jgi:Trypsin-like peptidase domain
MIRRPWIYVGMLAIYSQVAAVCAQDSDSYRNLVVMVHVATSAGPTGGFGAGIVVAQSEARTIIVTANHVIRDEEGNLMDNIATEFWTRRGERFPATANALYTNTELDLAVLFVTPTANRPIPRVLSDPLLKVISPSPPSALTSESMQLMGFTGRQPWATGPATDKIIRSDRTSLLIRSHSVAVGNSGGAVFDSFKRLVGLVTRIPSGGGETHALPMKVVLDQLARWNLEVSLQFAAAPTGLEELAAFFEKATQIRVQFPASKPSAAQRGPSSMSHLVSIVFPSGVEALKPQVRLEFGHARNPRRFSFAPPEYVAEVAAPPVVLQARLFFDLADGRKVGPIGKTIDFESGPFAAAKNKSEIVQLKNTASGWKRVQEKHEEIAKATEERKLKADETLRPKRMSHLLGVLKSSYPRWRIVCQFISEPKPSQWNCSTQSFTTQFSSLKPLNAFIKDLAVSREPGAAEIGIPLDTESWRETFNESIAQLLKNGADGVYVIVRLQNGDGFGPKQLCARTVERRQERHECK